MSKRLFILLLLVVLLFPAIGPDAAAQEAQPATLRTFRSSPELTIENAGQPMRATGLPLLQVGDFTGQAAVPAAEIAAVLASATQVAAGGDHTCALTAAGGVKCWGANYAGQLGDGTTTSRATPVDVVGLPAGVAALAAGAYHTCALIQGTGGVKCWGANWYGQLGDGTTNSSLTPVDVAGLTTGAAALAAGVHHTCALIQGTGGVKCWGANDHGQLGDGTMTSRPAPVDVTGLPAGAAGLAAGGYHTCAVTQGTGGVKCWGDNLYGQLGDGTATDRPAPVDVAGLSAGVTALAAGIYHTCAVAQGTGGVKCWGNNWYGQLGNGTTNPSTTPVDVVGLPAGAARLASGMYHTCAVPQGTGGVKCWGNNYYGQVGDGTTTDRPAPVDVTGLPAGVASLAAGGAHTCAVIQGTGEVRCWGDNHYGQLGNATTGYRPAPVDIAGLSAGAAGLAADGMHTCVVTQGTGGVKCWGDNWYGQLGNGTTNPSATPVDVMGLAAGPAGLAAGGYHTCAVTQATGGVKCWGDNHYGQLGNGTTNPGLTPVDVAGLPSGVTALAAGGAHTCALIQGTGGVKCWGNNDYGQLGDGTTTDRLAPVDVAGLPGGVASLTAGVSHTCAVTQKAGGVKCWGNNDYGQLGDGTTTDRPAPVDVAGLPAAAALTAGESHTCALIQGTGGVKCWGDNWYGQLGNGTTNPSANPVDVAGLPAAAGLAAGWSHTCAVIQGTGGVKCWGDGSHGQLGFNPGWTPMNVVGFKGYSAYLPLLHGQR